MAGEKTSAEQHEQNADQGHRYWLGVVSRAHVRRGVERGIAQIGHGKQNGLRRMSEGDWLVYYSPREGIREGEVVKGFTAIGKLPDDEIWQAADGDFKPWRRRVDYRPDAREIPISELSHELELTASPNWGYSLRRGLLELSSKDFAVIDAAMRSR